jgi:hypothetical protein
MKNILSIIVLLLFVSSTTIAQEFKAEYKLLNRSYEVFKKCFAENNAGNFDNVKILSEELVEKSLDLTTDSLPSSVVTGKVKENMAIITNQTKAVYSMLRGEKRPSNQELTTALKKLDTAYSNLMKELK